MGRPLDTIDKSSAKPDELRHGSPVITEEQIPDPHLLNSMRSVGYSLESALSDLIDNSLAAEASRVEIFYRSTGDQPLVAIVDDGRGMDPAEARKALRLAAVSSSESRSATDLGRFGLGLKTASLSQARVLTVVSKKHDVVTALQWDLDCVARLGTWSLNVLDEQDIASLPLVEKITGQESGTLVLLQNLDLLIGDAADPSKTMAEKFAIAADHIELVFHRFIAGESSYKPIHVSINGRRLVALDPFLASHTATQRSPIEHIGTGANGITVQSFTLPHISKLTEEEREKGRIGKNMRDSQGFYVYRSRRLIDWGTWFRLASKDELGKLARVKVDIPNSLDGLWGLDIKKSRAIPPEGVRKELRRLVDRIVGQSKTVHQYRGRPDESQPDGVFVWELIQARDSFSYRINRDHPVLAQVEDRQEQERLETILEVIEETFPVHDI